MEIIIESINITENTKIVKSVNWSYGEISGNKELEEINPNNFIDFENLDNTIITSWLENIIDFNVYNITEKEKVLFEKIISISLNK